MSRSALWARHDCPETHRCVRGLSGQGQEQAEMPVHVGVEEAGDLHDLAGEGSAG
jgi:hypothetical protein